MIKTLKELFEIEEEDLLQKPSYQIYCDLDGVLADFDTQYEYYTGFTPTYYKETYGKKPFWDVINNVGEIYWEAMPMMPDGKALWNFIRPYKPKILSSPSNDQSSKTGKHKWVKRNLTPTPLLIFAKAEEKHQYSGEGKILIDDRADTIERWNNQGGIGILHEGRSASKVMDQLEKLGYGK